MKAKHFSAALIVLLAAFPSNTGQADPTDTFKEDFTGPTTNNNWYFLGGACLTAGTSTATSSPGLIPGCGTVLANYYNKAANSDPYLVGGDSGFLGSATAPGSVSGQVPDPYDSVNKIGYGALRFTNGSQNIGGSMKYGHNERGATAINNYRELHDDEGGK